MQQDELSLASRAAWLSYVGNYTQEEIAGRLGVSRIKVNRLIGQAVRAGLVHVFVEGTAAECIELEESIARRWGLAFCTVAPMVDESPLPLATLAAAGGHWLHRTLETGRVSLVGVGHGRTLGAVVANLPRTPRPGVRFVSLLGSLTRHAAANPFDVIHRLAEITGAESYFLPAPFFADSVEDKQVLMAQRSIESVFALARAAELVIVGIGEVGPEAHLRTIGMITPEEHAAIERAGAVGEVLGRFLDARGRPVMAEINERAIAVRLEELKGRQIVAIAGGRGKARAIAAVLESGLLTGLITDEATAREIAAIGHAAAGSGAVFHPTTRVTAGRARDAREGT
ncbi:sugar-binding transcriptional regulator [Benzoatithermus flavus]|uniref:Sugar-binding transcriptional regulator n=1 Tax=Benzoatithermus flavus TaxID=3108223 RepID=A0ABU8XK56_9PROT